MSLTEAAFFYGDYSELFKELQSAELSENVEATIPHEEILSCFNNSFDL